jgi:prepilin-type N-terminal cleavage/methylation domain-containing protein
VSKPRTRGTLRCGLSSGQAGVTLLELLVVLGVLAALAAIVVPNVSGFLGRGKSRAYETDRAMLQAAVDSWRSDVALRTATPWPILEGGTPCLGEVNLADGSLPTPGCNPYIDMAALAVQDFLRDADAVKSADPARNTSATGASGSYGWYLDASGNVASYPTYQENRYP